MTAIHLENISKMYRIYSTPSSKLKEGLIRGIFRSRRSYHREFWALKDVNLVIPKGVTLGVIGQNGSGKSTLLQVITKILQPTAGSVKVEGRIAALLELGAGFNREFTGRENVFMNGSILGISHKEIEERFDQIAAFADIGDFIDQPVKIYSSGMYVRLAFATAVNVDPDILIVDEALAVGDAMFQRKCYRRMEEFQKAGKTIILVTHALQTIRGFCNHAILMDSGHILEQGKPSEVINSYNKLMAMREETQNSGASPVLLEGEGGDRYGFGGAEVVEVALLNEDGAPTTVLEGGKTFTVRVKVRFHQPVEHPFIGMLVNTLTGVQVYGTTTDYSGSPLGPQGTGSLITVDFEHKCHLNAGSYTLSAGVSEDVNGDVRPLDRRMDVIAFRVVRKDSILGLVQQDIQARIVEKKNVSESSLHLS